MSKMITATLLPNRQVDKESITIGDVVAVTPDNTVSVYIGSTVELHRAVEILNGWRWLWNGLRDRALLAITTNITGHLYSASDINSLTENDRRTSWADATPVTTSDIAIGISYQVAEQLAATVMVESAVEAILEFAKEQLFIN